MTVAEFGLTWEQSDQLRQNLEDNIGYGKFLCLDKLHFS